MTDPTPTTDEEIALELGWCKLGPSVWRHPDGAIWNAVPDYEYDWAHAGPLLEEMVDARYWSANISSPVAGESWLLYMEEDGETLFNISGRGDTLTEAISRAWLAWKKEEHPKPEKKLSQTEGYMKLIMENDEAHPND